LSCFEVDTRGEACLGSCGSCRSNRPVHSRNNRIEDPGVDCSVCIHTEDHVQVLIALQLDGVDHADILLESLDALDEGLAEHEQVDVAVPDGVRREGSREPGLADARVEDATAVAELLHVPVEQLRRGWYWYRAEDLGLLAVDPVVVVRLEEVGEDDVAEVTKPERGGVLLEDVDGRDEGPGAEGELPDFAPGEHADEGEGEHAEDRTGVDGGAEGAEARELVAEFGDDGRAEGQVHRTRALRVTDVGDLGVAGGAGDELNDVLEIVGEVLDAPGPEARVGAGVLGVTGTETGADVCEPDIKALVDEPEGHGSLLVQDEVGRVAENTVLEDDGVTSGTRATRVGETVSLEDPPFLCDNLQLIALVTPVLGVILDTAGQTLAGDATLVLSVGPSLLVAGLERVEVPCVCADHDDDQAGQSGAEGDQLENLGLDLVEALVLGELAVAVIVER